MPDGGEGRMQSIELQELLFIDTRGVPFQPGHTECDFTRGSQTFEVLRYRMI